MNQFEKSENELPDFFSMLPEPLTHHILSFLPFTDIVRTSVLSKMWSRIWFNYPNIDLFLHEQSYIDKLHRHSFIDHIKSVMDQCILRKDCIHKLQLKVYADNLEELAPIMDQWMKAAIERNVSELVFEMNFAPTAYYNIPKEVFVSNSLKVLQLEGCKFDDSFSRTNLPHLQKLKTMQCLFAGENVLSKILCGCPELEYLQALVSEGMRSFLSVSRKPRLKYFHIGRCNELERIEIFVPSLETLKCDIPYSCSIDLASCTLLKHLEIHHAILSSDYVPIQYLLSNLLQIEELHLSNCKPADKIQISSPCLKRLVITEYKSFPGAELDIPNLLSLDFFSMGECNKNNRFSSWNVPKVEEILMLFSVKSFRSSCRGGLKGFLRQLQNYEDVKLIIQCRGKQDLIMHEKLQAVSFSSLNKFLKKAQPRFVLISSRRDDSFLARLLVSREDNVSLSMIFSSRRSIELLHEKLSNVSFLKRWYREFQLVSIEEIEREMDSDWKPFFETHSIGNNMDANALFAMKKKKGKAQTKKKDPSGQQPVDASFQKDGVESSAAVPTADGAGVSQADAATKKKSGKGGSPPAKKQKKAGDVAERVAPVMIIEEQSSSEPPVATALTAPIGLPSRDFPRETLQFSLPPGTSVMHGTVESKAFLRGITSGMDMAAALESQILRCTLSACIALGEQARRLEEWRLLKAQQDEKLKKLIHENSDVVRQMATLEEDL